MSPDIWRLRKAKCSACGIWLSSVPVQVERAVTEGASPLPRLLICLTFPFRAEALSYLFEVLLSLGEIRSAPLDVRIFTDCGNLEEQDWIHRLARHVSVGTMRVSVEIHETSEPLPLSWAHKPWLRSLFDIGTSYYTHFVYLDDLIRFSSRNLFYFLKYRPILRPFGLVPGFVQVEFSNRTGSIVLPDLPAPMRVSGRGIVDLGDVDFMALDAPFVPMHVMDADLVREYLASPASDLEASRALIGWGDAQRSAMGLTFINPPQHHSWRVAVPILRSQGTPSPGAWVHHVSNAIAARHAAEPDFPLGRIGLDNLLLDD